jgi:hypothetical protein
LSTVFRTDAFRSKARAFFDHQPALQTGDLILVILNLESNPADLNEVKSGILFLKDKMVVKTETGDIQTQTYDNIPDFSVDKYQLSGWISQNRIKLWIAGLVVTLLAVLLGTVFTGIIWITRLAFGAVIFWLVGRFAFKKAVTYLQSFNIAIYASVLPLLISFILSLSQNGILGYFGLFLFFFFGISWIRNLPGKTLPHFTRTEVQACLRPQKSAKPSSAHSEIPTLFQIPSKNCLKTIEVCLFLKNLFSESYILF